MPRSSLLSPKGQGRSKNPRRPSRNPRQPRCLDFKHKEPTMSETPRHIHCVKPEHTGARVTVRLQPEDHWLSIPRPKTSRQLLTALGLAEECALVARDGELLTPDRQIWPNDELLVRKVASVG